MWRSTPLHRHEILEPDAEPAPAARLPGWVSRQTEVQAVSDGFGPLFHRRYSTRIRESPLTADELFAKVTENLNRAAPVTMARFQRVRGDADTVALADEYVVRMPGPWDGPVRVIERGPRVFRLATLAGHLEAGQIEFRVSDGDLITFEIESWARSSNRYSNLLYHHVRHGQGSPAAHVDQLSGGRCQALGGAHDRRHHDRHPPGRGGVLAVKLTPATRRRLATMERRPLNYDPDDLDLANPGAGWNVDDRFQALPAESPGAPERAGSFEIATRLIRGYEFADPSLVRAYYHPDAPLEGRTMLLELRALNLIGCIRRRARQRRL